MSVPACGSDRPGVCILLCTLKKDRGLAMRANRGVPIKTIQTKRANLKSTAVLVVILSTNVKVQREDANRPTDGRPTDSRGPIMVEGLASECS